MAGESEAYWLARGVRKIPVNNKPCPCGQVFYTNSDGRERLPHVAGEYESCAYDRDGRRRCCGTEENQWHSRPCTVNGPTGPIGCHPPIGCAMEEIGAGEEGRILLGVDHPQPHTPESERQEFGPPLEIMEVRGRQNGKVSGAEAEAQRRADTARAWQGGPRYVETNNLPPGPMVVGEFTERGTGLVRALAGLDYGYPHVLHHSVRRERWHVRWSLALV